MEPWQETLKIALVCFACGIGAALLVLLFSPKARENYSELANKAEEPSTEANMTYSIVEGNKPLAPL